MIAQTFLTKPTLPFRVRHAILTATAASTPQSPLGEEITAQTKKAALAQLSQDQRMIAQRARQVKETIVAVSVAGSNLHRWKLAESA